MRKKYENPEARIEDFNILNDFLKQTEITSVTSLELGAGEGWFTIIAKSHGWEVEAIDVDKTLESVKFGYVKFGNVNDLVLKKKFNVVHSNLFMYMSFQEVIDFFEKNVSMFDLIFISYNTDRKDNRFDEERISFFDENFFKKIALRFNLEYFKIENTIKRILYKKEVIKIGS
ncbi:MAG: hypothetical protein ACRCX2_07290 [Paraclostridium sp.]